MEKIIISKDIVIVAYNMRMWLCQPKDTTKLLYCEVRINGATTDISQREVQIKYPECKAIHNILKEKFDGIIGYEDVREDTINYCRIVCDRVLNKG